jgi:hypothetical protein
MRQMIWEIQVKQRLRGLEATASVLAYIGTVMLTDPPSVSEDTDGDSDLGDARQTTATG